MCWTMVKCVLATHKMSRGMIWLCGHGQANFDGIFLVEGDGEHGEFLHRLSTGGPGLPSRGLASLLSKNFTSEGPSFALGFASCCRVQSPGSISLLLLNFFSLPHFPPLFSIFSLSLPFFCHFGVLLPHFKNIRIVFLQCEAYKLK